MKVTYKFAFDVGYYTAVLERYYAQQPLMLRLPQQFALLWLALLALLILTSAISDWISAIGFSLLGALVVPCLILLTKRITRWRFTRRLSVNSEMTLSLTAEGVDSIGIRGAASNGWGVYLRGVRFPDGILLVRRGAVRWLPDSALICGTASDATALVAEHVTLRQTA